MEQNQTDNETFVPIKISRATAQKLKSLFPDVVYSDAVDWLLSRYGDGLGDHASCANTELWIKLDRLEEIFSALALTNVAIADVYRRQVGGELPRLRNVSGKLAAVAKAHSTGEGTP